MNILKPLTNIFSNSDIPDDRFIKKFTSEDPTITKLEELKQQCLNSSFPDSHSLITEIDEQINNLSYGKMGEENIARKLRYSNINMYILYDIYLTQDDLHSQIDFILITQKHIYLIESKWRSGDNVSFELRENGVVCPHHTINGKWKSNEKLFFPKPFAQNEEHRLLLYKFIRNHSILKKYISEERLKDIVVLSNPSSVIYIHDNVPSNMSSRLLLLENLIDYIITTDKASHLRSFRQSQMLEIANILSEHSGENNTNYIKHFENRFQDSLNALKQLPNLPTDDELTNYLQLYRKIQAKKECSQKGNKPLYYCVYNDRTLDEIVKLRPQTSEELLHIYGIGEVKLQKYGKDILQIVNGEIPDCLKNQF